MLILHISQAEINPVNLSLTLTVRIKQCLDYTNNRIQLLKLTICIWKIVKICVYKYVFSTAFAYD